MRFSAQYLRSSHCIVVMSPIANRVTSFLIFVYSSEPWNGGLKVQNTEINTFHEQDGLGDGEQVCDNDNGDVNELCVQKTVKQTILSLFCSDLVSLSRDRSFYYVSSRNTTTAIPFHTQTQTPSQN